MAWSICPDRSVSLNVPSSIRPHCLPCLHLASSRSVSDSTPLPPECREVNLGALSVQRFRRTRIDIHQRRVSSVRAWGAPYRPFGRALHPTCLFTCFGAASPYETTIPAAAGPCRWKRSSRPSPRCAPAAVAVPPAPPAGRCRRANRGNVRLATAPFWVVDPLNEYCGFSRRGSAADGSWRCCRKHLPRRRAIFVFVVLRQGAPTRPAT